jgi:hypothetical protein
VLEEAGRLVRKSWVRSTSATGGVEDTPDFERKKKRLAGSQRSAMVMVRGGFGRTDEHSVRCWLQGCH